MVKSKVITTSVDCLEDQFKAQFIRLKYEYETPIWSIN